MNIQKMKIYHYLLLMLLAIADGCISIAIYRRSEPLAAVSILGFYFLAALLSKHLFHAGAKATSRGMLISCGVGYSINFIASTTYAWIFTALKSEIPANHPFSIITVFLINSVLVILVCRNKRLKHGMPMIFSKKPPVLISIASIIIIGIYLYLSVATPSANPFSVFLIVFLSFLSVLISLIIKNNFKKTYLERQRKRESEYLYSAIETYQAKIESLEKENCMLASVIHKDNKLLPAMSQAVAEIINQEENHYNKQKIIDKLNQLFQEREDILKIFSDAHQNELPKINLFLIDIMNEYIFQKAKEKNIDYQIKAEYTDFKKFISEKDLCTLIADLTENAIHAAENENHQKMILLELTKEENFPVISVYDTGTEFSTEVLRHIGLEKYTTRKNQGGSGIGLMSAYQLAQKYQAGFMITEYPPGSEFSKKISFLFQQKSEYQIISYRYEFLKYSCARNDIKLSPL